MKRNFKDANVLYAWLSGTDVQFKNPDGNWCTWTLEYPPGVDLKGTEWRIKPKKWYINIYLDEGGFTCSPIPFNTKPEAEELRSEPAYVTTVEIEG